MKPKVSFLTRIASLLLHLSMLVILFYFGMLLYEGLTIVSEDSAAALQYFIDLLDTELFLLAGSAVMAWLFADMFVNRAKGRTGTLVKDFVFLVIILILEHWPDFSGLFLAEAEVPVFSPELFLTAEYLTGVLLPLIISIAVLFSFRILSLLSAAGAAGCAVFRLLALLENSASVSEEVLGVMLLSEALFGAGMVLGLLCVKNPYRD